VLAVRAKRLLAGLLRADERPGLRIVDPNSLQLVMPDAENKTHFVIVVAVGVCEDDKAAT
jgi:hypothetical protein